MVGDHFRAIAGHHAHGGFVFRGGRHVNRVVANARAAYDLQVWQRRKNFGRECAVRGHNGIGIGGVANDILRLGPLKRGDFDVRGACHGEFEIVVLEIGVGDNDFRHGSNLSNGEVSRPIVQRVSHRSAKCIAIGPKRLLFARVHLLRFAKNATKCVAYCASEAQSFLRFRKTPGHTFSKARLA